MSSLKNLIISNHPIQRRFRELARIESKLNQELIPRVLYNPGLRVSVSLNTRKVKDVFLLYHVRECLPPLVRMEVEERFTRLNECLPPLDLMLAWCWMDKLVSGENLRFLNGRAMVRLYDVLGKIRLNFAYPSKPKFTQRPRVYKDQGCLASEQTKSARKLAIEAAAEKDDRKKYNDFSFLEQARASEILMMSIEGDNPELIAETATALTKRLSEYDDPAARFEVEKDDCRYLAETGWTREEFERMFPKGSLPCEFCPSRLKVGCRTSSLYCELAQLDLI